MPTKTILERDVEAHLVKQAKALRGQVRKVKWIGRRAAPDRVLMMPFRIHTTSGVTSTSGGTIWVELKAPGEVPEPHQAREHDRMRKVGQRVVVLDSIEAVDFFLEEFQ